VATASDIRAGEYDLEIAALIEDEAPRDPEELRRLRSAVLDNALYRGTLAAADGRAAALLVYLDPLPDAELIRLGVDERVAAIAHEEAGGAEVWISGFPHFKAVMSSTLQRQLAFVLPAVVLVLTLVLIFALRTVRGVLVPLGTIALSVLWTLGAVAALGGSLNIITTIVPPLILTLAYAYAMHVMFDYTDAAQARGPDETGDGRSLVKHVLETVGVPVLVTGVTTAAGFLALAVSPIPAIRQFGLYSLLGVMLTVLVALTFAPATLALLPPLPRREAGTATRPIDRAAAAMADFAFRRRGIVIGVSVLLLLGSFAAMSQIRVASHFLTAFDPESQVRRDFESINERLGGANSLQVLLETPLRGGMLNPEILGAIEELQRWLESQPEIGKTTSIADYLMLVNRAFQGGGSEHLVVPKSQNLASQLLLFAGGDDSDRMIDRGHQLTSVDVLASVGDSGAVGALVDRIEKRLAEFPSAVSASVTGNMVLVSKSVNDVARGQWGSLLLAFGIIFLVLSALFTSFRVGLIALFPNVLPIAVYFGALGATGITLNNSTSLVGCLALGIAVDDTIHYFARFNADARRLGDEQRATRAALVGLIRPVTFTSLGLVIGFLALTTSELRPQIEFGALAAFTLAMAWVVDVTLSPALCAGLRIVTLWDTMPLDIGPDPQRSIPLFDGLSPRRARIFTLMSDLTEVAAGDSLFEEDDAGEDMYVILEGEVEASVQRGDERVSLARMKRGDTLGETGLFGGKRTARIHALTPARLIRFGTADLERLGRRYPRIASRVFFNLNRIQAERLVRTTQRVR
jgi:predicted RND superfamily exporter protein